MEIFIGNIPAEAKLIELYHILGAQQMHSDFSTHEGRDWDHRKYHFVIVNTENRSQGVALIQRLSGTEISDRKLDIREYIHRENKDQSIWNGEDRRINKQLALNL